MPNYTKLRPSRYDDPRRLEIERKIAADLLALRAALGKHIREQREPGADGHGTVRIATWNLRDFGKKKRGPRLDEAIYYIAEIISAFDVVALQEIYRDLTEFNEVLRVLGGDWDYLMTDASTDARGNDERMVFLFNRNKVRWRNVTGELALSSEQRLLLPNSFDLTPAAGVRLDLPPGTEFGRVNDLKIKTKTTVRGTTLEEEVVYTIPPGTMVTLPEGAELVFRGYAAAVSADGSIDLKSGSVRELGAGSAVRLPPAAMVSEETNLARTPFLVTLQAGWLKLSLTTVHIYFGDDAKDSLKLLRRQEEIRALTKVLADKAGDENDNDADNYFILLGDFNIVSREHGTMQALEDNGFKVPEKIRQIPAGSNVSRNKYYDQMAVWEGESRRRPFFRDYTGIEVTGAGVFDFYEHVFRQGPKYDADGGEERWYRKRMEEAGKEYSYAGDWRTYHMSDHLPMWIELRSDFADRYLENVTKTKPLEPG